jgi:hypothetical protein
VTSDNVNLKRVYLTRNLLSNLATSLAITPFRYQIPDLLDISVYTTWRRGSHLGVNLGLVGQNLRQEAHGDLIAVLKLELCRLRTRLLHNGAGIRCTTPHTHPHQLQRMSDSHIYQKDFFLGHMMSRCKASLKAVNYTVGPVGGEQP